MLVVVLRAAAAVAVFVLFGLCRLAQENVSSIAETRRSFFSHWVPGVRVGRCARAAAAVAVFVPFRPRMAGAVVPSLSVI